MNQLKTIENNSITTNINPIKSNINQWLEVKPQQETEDTCQLYTTLYKKYHLSNKWILMINPENQTLEQLHLEGKINPSTILKIDANKVKIGLNDIEKALSTGNCAAVILCKASLKTNEISKLTACAQKGKTPCIVLNKQQHLH